MSQQNEAVEQIIEFINGKVAMLQGELAKFDNPIMQEMVKSSPHLQLQYTQLSAELKANRENLLAIEKFNPIAAKNTPDSKSSKKDEKHK